MAKAVNPMPACGTCWVRNEFQDSSSRRWCGLIVDGSTRGLSLRSQFDANKDNNGDVNNDSYAYDYTRAGINISGMAASALRTDPGHRTKSLLQRLKGDRFYGHCAHNGGVT